MVSIPFRGSRKTYSITIYLSRIYILNVLSSVWCISGDRPENSEESETKRGKDRKIQHWNCRILWSFICFYSLEHIIIDEPEDRYLIRLLGLCGIRIRTKPIERMGWELRRHACCHGFEVAQVFLSWETTQIFIELASPSFEFGCVVLILVDMALCVHRNLYLSRTDFSNLSFLLIFCEIFCLNYFT